MTLSPNQLKAVTSRDGHIMVEAGAGSGKTTTLVEKLLYETGLADGDAPSGTLGVDQVVAVTFTRKAASEIKDRLRRRILEQASRRDGIERERLAMQAFRIDQADIGTIDSVAHRIVRDYGPYAGVDAGYALLDAGEAEALRLEVAGEAILNAVEVGEAGARTLVRHFGFLRARRFLADALEQPEVLRGMRADLGSGRLGLAALGEHATRVDEILAPHALAILRFLLSVGEAYGKRLVKEGALDFAHLVLAAVKVLRKAEARAAITQRIRLLVVDEHQDTSPLQAHLLFRLAGLPPPGRTQEEAAQSEVRMVLIGDPKQSIYSFRHADVRQWQASRTTIEAAGGAYIALDRCYRSLPTLVRFHDAVPGRILSSTALHPYEVPYQTLQAVRTEAEPGEVELLLVDPEEVSTLAMRVAARIREMLDHAEAYPVHDAETGVARPVRSGDIAVLARQLKSTSAPYIQAFQEHRIDFRIAGGGGLYQRSEIHDVAAVLGAVADPHDPFALAAFLRSPFGGVDDRTLDALVSARTRPEAAPGSLYDALRSSDLAGLDAAHRERARDALGLLEALLALRDRVGHDDLIRRALELSDYRAFLAGAPDAPLGLRNLEKLLRAAGAASTEPLYTFVEKLAARIQRADREEEAPLYASDESLVTLSTVHSAKGLEWPVVFVTELQEPVTRGVRRAAGPRLSPAHGVVLPLDVVLREGGQSVPAKETSFAWEEYARDRIGQDYAEATRLFYVACTRARDRLVLCGALHPARGAGLVSRPEDRGWDRMDRWLQKLVPGLAEAGPAGDTRIEYRGVRYRVSMQDASPGQGTDPTRDWPGTIGLTGPAEGLPTEVLERRTGPPRPGLIRTEFAVSEFLQYSICPWKHFYGYRAGLSSPNLEVTPEESLINSILPERRGDILHHYLGQHDDAWDDATIRAELKRVILWHLPMDDALAERNVDALVGHIRNYLKSDIHQRVKEARVAGRPVSREVPFLLRLAPDVRVRGAIDLLLEDEDGWTAVDYKTGLFGADEAGHADTVRERTERYRIQAAIYALAVQAALGEGQLKRFHFFFTPPGLESSIAITDAWPAEERARAVAIARRIRAGDYGGEPAYGATRCPGCEYRPVCRPTADPLAEGSVTQRYIAS